MIEYPPMGELLSAMANVLSEEIVPATEGPAKHSARVVANLCRILAREVELGPGDAAATAAALQVLLGDDGPGLSGDPASLADLVDELDRRIATGNSLDSLDSAALLGDAELRSVLEASVARRLAIARPDYEQSGVDPAVRELP